MTTSPRRVRFAWLFGLVLLLGTAIGAVSLLNQPASGTGTGTGTNKGGRAEPGMLGVVGGGFADVEGGIAFLHPLQAGRVVKVLVQEGDSVKEGDLILSVDSRLQQADLDACSAELAAAKVALQDAETQLPKKWKNEIEKQTHHLEGARQELNIAELEDKIAQDSYLGKYAQISKEQREIAKIKVERMKEAVKANEAALQEIKDQDPKGTIERARETVNAKKAQRNKAEVALSDCNLLAPADGTILRLYATPGDVLSTQPRQAAVNFCPNKQRIIRVEILQEFAGKIKIGQLADIEDDTRAGVLWHGKVERVADWFTHRRSILQEPFQYNDVRTLECIVYLDPGGPPVRIGQRLRVTIKQGGP